MNHQTGCHCRLRRAHAVCGTFPSVRPCPPLSSSGNCCPSCALRLSAHGAWRSVLSARRARTRWRQRSHRRQVIARVPARRCAASSLCAWSIGVMPETTGRAAKTSPRVVTGDPRSGRGYSPRPFARYPMRALKWMVSDCYSAGTSARDGERFTIKGLRRHLGDNSRGRFFNVLTRAPVPSFARQRGHATRNQLLQGGYG